MTTNIFKRSRSVAEVPQPSEPDPLERLDLELEHERENAFARTVLRHHAAYTSAVRDAAAELGYTPRRASALLDSWGHRNIALSILLPESRPE